MKHIILLLFIISFILGIASMLMMVLYYLECKKPFIKYILQCDLFFSCLLFMDTMHYYIEINRIVVGSLTYMIILFGLLVFGICMIYFLFKAVHEVLDIKFPRYWQLLYWSIAALFIVTHLSLNILYATETLIKYFEYPNSFMLHNLFTAIGAAMNITLLVKRRNKINYEIRKVVLIGIIIISSIVPISIIINGMEYWVDFNFPLPFSPILYFTSNLIIMLVTLRYFFVKQEVSETSLEDLLKDYLGPFDITEREYEIISCVIEGLNNQEIGDRLFISANTVKNHIYNIYKKLGIKNRFELMSQINQYGKPL